jgi:hypothetical protein
MIRYFSVASNVPNVRNPNDDPARDERVELPPPDVDIPENLELFWFGKKV